MRTLVSKHKNLPKEFKCSWGDKSNLHLLKKDLSNAENLKMAMERFPMLEKLVNRYEFSLQEIERCRKECHNYVFSERDEIWQLKEFFRHWLIRL